MSHGHSHSPGGPSHSHSHGQPQQQQQRPPPGAIQIPHNPNYIPPSSVDELISLHDLSIDATSTEQTISISSSSSKKPSKDLLNEIAAVNSLTRNLLAAKIENTPPQPPQVQPFAPPTLLRTNLFQKAKEEGNNFFKNKDYVTALQKYNIALHFARTRPSYEPSALARDEIGVILANRAATYMALSCYVEALCDADVIVQIRKGWPKGHFRKGKALVALGQLQEARDAFIFGLDFVPGEKDLQQALDEVNAQIEAKRRKQDESAQSPVLSSQADSQATAL